jgi:hypothetical protein
MESNSPNVYVNVTWYSLVEDGIKFSKCLCECYMIFFYRRWNQILQMFMWMLHDILLQKMESNSQNVYVNVTCYSFIESSCQMFMWMLHDILL